MKTSLRGIVTIIIVTSALVCFILTLAGAKKNTGITVNPWDAIADINAAIDTYDVVNFNPGTYNLGDDRFIVDHKSVILRGISDAAGNKPKIIGNGFFVAGVNKHVVLVYAPGESVEIDNLRIESTPTFFNTGALVNIASDYFKVINCEIICSVPDEENVNWTSALWVLSYKYAGLSDAIVTGDVIIKDTEVSHNSKWEGAGIRISDGGGEERHPLDSIEIKSCTVDAPYAVWGILLENSSDENTTTTVSKCTIDSTSPFMISGLKGNLYAHSLDLVSRFPHWGGYKTGMIISGDANGIINDININIYLEEGGPQNLLGDYAILLGHFDYWYGYSLIHGCRNKVFNNITVEGTARWMVFSLVYSKLPNLAPVTNNVIKNIRRENLIVNQYEYLLAGPGTHNYDNVIIDNYVAEDGSFARIYDGSSQPQAAWMAAWMAESTVTPWGTFSNSDVLGWYGGDGAMNVWYHNCDPSGPQDWCPPGWDPSSGLCCFLSSPPFPPQEIYDGGANILRGRLQKLYGIVGD